MNDKERLRRAILDLHGVEGRHVRTVPVHETHGGETMWEGDVEEYAITGHPKAVAAYAWTDEGDDGKAHHVAVLGVPPINSAVDAVKAAAVKEARKRVPPR